MELDLEKELFGTDFHDSILNMAARFKSLGEELEESANGHFCYMENQDELNISNLKSKIKYCKNPLELKMLNRQLNKAYKNLKTNK